MAEPEPAPSLLADHRLTAAQEESFRRDGYLHLKRCIPAELVGRCERYERLGMRHPDQACYIHCQEQCKEIAKEKKLEAAQAAAGGGEGRGRKKKSPPGSAKQRGGGAKRAKHAE